MGNHAEPNEVSGYSTGNYAGYQPDQHTDDHNDTGRTVAPTTVGCWKQGEGCTGNPDTDSSHAPVVSDSKIEGFANTKMSNKTMMMILFAMILIGGIIFMMRKKKMAASAAPVAPVV